MSAVNAIVFDFNGTLSDDEPVLCEIFIEMFAERGRPLSAQEYYDQLAGLSDPEIVLTWLGRDYPDVGGAVDERVQRYCDAVADGSTVHRARARGRRLRSRTRTPRDLLRGGAGRDRAGRRVGRLAQFLRGIVSSDDVAHGKPHPEGYLKALGLFGDVDPGQVLAIDDTEAGVASAKAAGLLTFAKTGTLDPHRLPRPTS